MSLGLDIDRLSGMLARGKVVVLTGAGISTDSGIPDYRGPGTLARARSPMKYQQFAKSAEARRRYWRRSVVGWPSVATAKPNPGHRVLAELEQRQVVSGLITQNVDRLHQAAGSQRIVELHGALADVVCLECGARFSRKDIQARLIRDNPNLAPKSARLAPDGDADVAGSEADMVVPSCELCGGVLKPDVVFFGESVPRTRVAEAFALVDQARGLLVAGSSLTVYSGLRFVRRAHELGIPIAIVNIGPTRGDELADIRIDAPLGQVLPRLADQ